MSLLQDIDGTGAFLIDLPSSIDSRGEFSKIYQESWFYDFGNFIPKESYWTTSKKNVLRGFHLQISHASQKKICSCLFGSILDVIVDLRKGHKFGRTYSKILSSKNKKAIFVPEGFGHAFYNLSETDSIVHYLVGTEYSPSNDTGVKWDSVDFDWPNKKPVISSRDLKLNPLESFKPL